MAIEVKSLHHLPEIFWRVDSALAFGRKIIASFEASSGVWAFFHLSHSSFHSPSLSRS